MNNARARGPSRRPSAGRPAGRSLLTAAALLSCLLPAQTVPASAVRPANWAQPLERPGVPNLHGLDKRLYRSAQPTAEGMRQLKRIGIRTIINLRSFHSDRAEIGDTGLAYEHLYVKPWHPEEEELVRFLQIVTDEARTPALVHCQHGADRTGTLCAVYRMAVCGWTREEALREMTQGGFGFHPFWDNLTAYLRNLDIERIRRRAGITAPAPVCPDAEATLCATVLPPIQFRDADIRDALTFLRQAIERHGTPAPAIVWNAQSDAEDGPPTVTYAADTCTARDTLEGLTLAAGMPYRIEPRWIVVGKQVAPPEIVTAPDAAATERELASAVIPTTEWRRAALADCIRFLAASGRRHAASRDPDLPYASLVLDEGLDPAAVPPLTLSAQGLSVLDLLAILTQIAPVTCRIARGTVLISGR
ncbi:MAG: tyrosine-protein phosphatase [Kiritimatiellae bacterium]|nr:tyrosine-protein phosphatase [Kiritimatiellia bacterium]